MLKVHMQGYSNQQAGSSTVHIQNLGLVLSRLIMVTVKMSIWAAIMLLFCIVSQVAIH